MSNLLSETLEKIGETGHEVADVAYIGNLGDGDGHWSCDWVQFEKVADEDYDSSYGAAEVATDLVILFSDGSRLERGEYDGAEWWDFVPVITPPAEPGKQITMLVGSYWPSLTDLHDPKDAHHARA